MMFPGKMVSHGLKSSTVAVCMCNKRCSILCQVRRCRNFLM